VIMDAGQPDSSRTQLGEDGSKLTRISSSLTLPIFGSFLGIGLIKQLAITYLNHS